MLKYSEPRQNYKGMWITEVKLPNGLTQRAEYTTKKGLMAWIKQHKEQYKK